jgi:SanA protein
MRRSLRRQIRGALQFAAVLVIGIVALINNWVVNNSEAYVYNNWSLLPDNDVGLVLGTSQLTRNGKPNPQFYGRIEAAVQLYQLGKIKHIIVSGANPDSTYNEPRQMWRELTKAGVPSNVITMDFAGFRTFDSVARAQAVFNLDRLTIITQQYHAYRAVFTAKKLHIRVAGYAAPSEEIGRFSRTYWREVFARVKCVADIYLLSTEPKFLGRPEQITLPADEPMTPPPPSPSQDGS